MEIRVSQHLKRTSYQTCQIDYKMTLKGNLLSYLICWYKLRGDISFYVTQCSIKLSNYSIISCHRDDATRVVNNVPSPVSGALTGVNHNINAALTRKHSIESEDGEY